jgi:hypothetical protein
MPVIPAIGVRVTGATVGIGSPHIRMAAAVVAMFGIATAVPVADDSAAVGPPGLESPLAMSAMVDGHSAAGMDGADMSAVAEIRSCATSCLNTRPFSTGVEIVGAAIRAGLGIASWGVVPRHAGCAAVSGIGGTMRPTGRASVRGIGGTVRPAGGAAVGSIGGAVRPAGRAAVRGIGGAMRPAGPA